mmetsp:Transcript_126861/g.290251  ORF Transcript_126861/g.290251 Transcript_126861/m.290251 type:complete len:216 (+) Transcript_126861:109-756(+)
MLLDSTKCVWSCLCISCSSAMATSHKRRQHSNSFTPRNLETQPGHHSGTRSARSCGTSPCKAWCVRPLSSTQLSCLSTLPRPTAQKASYQQPRESLLPRRGIKCFPKPRRRTEPKARSLSPNSFLCTGVQSSRMCWITKLPYLDDARAASGDLAPLCARMASMTRSLASGTTAIAFSTTFEECLWLPKPPISLSRVFTTASCRSEAPNSRMCCTT